MLKYNNCPSCFAPVKKESFCTKCGYNLAAEKSTYGALPAFTVVGNRYLLGKVLGRGGFGITYIALDLQNNLNCAIKEYMPSEHSSRSNNSLNIIPNHDDRSIKTYKHGKEKFLLEVKTLQSLGKNPNVVNIWNYFPQNNTAYLVMEYLDGQNMRQMIKSQSTGINVNLAKEVFVTVASALMPIHNKGILHRDISPENIIITNSGQIKLIDFGAARSYVSAQNNGLSILLKPGYAPLEQYDKHGNQGPWTDVYALCATFYNVISGRRPVDAQFRKRGQRLPTLAELGCEVTQTTSNVIARGMELDINKRYKSFGQLLNDIDISTKPKQRTLAPLKPLPKKLTSKLQPNPEQKPLNEQASVMVTAGKNKGTAIVLSQNKIYIIGRSNEKADLVVGNDTNISRAHCEVRYDGTSFHVKDISANGTFFEKGGKLTKGTDYTVPVGSKIYLATQNNSIIFKK